LNAPSVVVDHRAQVVIMSTRQPDAKTQILYLITELSAGGAQSALVRLLGGMDRRRFSPSVACLYNGDSTVAQSIRALDISVFDAHMRHRADFPALLPLYRRIRRARPVILHSSLFHANLLGRILGRLAGVLIVICSERTMAMESEWRYAINRWTIGLADRVTAVSNSVQDFCISHIGLPANKLTVIRNGVELPERSPYDARAELGLPPDSFVIGAVSRLYAVKGIQFLVQALAKTGAQRLVVIGEGPEKPALEILAERLGVADRIHWLGHRPNAPNLMPAFDLFVQPSLHEGMPNTVLEAMAAGLPVVATAVGGTPEVVVHGVTGLLVPPKHPDALSKAISALLEDRDLGRRMGRAGRERVVEHFSVGRMIRETEELYAHLLAEKALAFMGENTE
jgi:glycosyltransferase involved in cell wall biosynthesis